MNDAIIDERLEQLAQLRLAGLSRHFTPATTVEMPALWGRLAASLGFEGQLGGGETYGVWRRRLPNGDFDFLAAVRIAPDCQPPQGLEILNLAPRRYLVFRQWLRPGDLHEQMVAATEAVWRQRLPRSGRVLASAPDFQVYQANFSLGEDAWIDHFLPVED